MATVELPAQNVLPGAFTGVVRTGGLDCLATRGTESGHVTFNWNDNQHHLYVGLDDGSNEVTGFGLWDQPSGATVTDVRFVAEGYIEGTSAAVDYDEFTGGSDNYTNEPTETYPLVLIAYGGDPWFFGGYNLSTFAEASEPADAECAVQLQHFIGGADYVIAGVGEPDTGVRGLCPEVFLPTYSTGPENDATLVMTYLAIRITYTSGGAPVVRQYPRDDGLGLSSAPRIYPPSKARRIVGGYQ